MGILRSLILCFCWILILKQGLGQQSNTVEDVTNILEELTGILQNLVGNSATGGSVSTTTVATTTTPAPTTIALLTTATNTQENDQLDDVALEVTKLLQQLTGVLQDLVQQEATLVTSSTTTTTTTTPTTITPTTTTTTVTTTTPTTTTPTTTTPTTTTPTTTPTTTTPTTTTPTTTPTTTTPTTTTPTTTTTTVPTTTTPTTTEEPGPMLENMPLDGNLPEGTNAITTIKCLTCTGVVPYTVRFVSVSPPTGCGNCFNIWDEDELDGTPNYCLRFVPGTNQLDYEKVSVYSVIVECVDANGRANRGQIEVRILPNSPPIITSPNSVSVSLPDKTVGSPVFQIEATDPNNDDLQYTLTPESRSSSDIFQIDNNGRITLKQNIENSCETSYSFSAYVTDSYNDRQGPVKINVEVENPNTPPTTDLLNQQISIDENTGKGTRLVNLGLLDASSSIMTVRPTNMEKHFTLKDGQLTVNTPFNYEVDNKANISFTFSNGFCESNYWLVVNVNDVNDEPELSPQVQSTQVEEGYISFNPEFDVKDEDFDDSHTFEFASTQGAVNQFSIDPVTGVITSNGEFDLDDRGLERDIVVLPVKVIDSKGKAVDTATVTLTVTEINDNDPEFTSELNRQLTIMDCDLPMRLMTVTAEDKDFARNGEVLYRSSTTSEGPITVTPGGAVYQTSPINAGENFIITVEAVDRGSPQRTSGVPVTISVVGVPCSTTPPPTTIIPAVVITEIRVTNRIINNIDSGISNNLDLTNITTSNQPDDFFGDPGNIIATVMASLLGLALLGLLGYLLWKFCCPTCCGLCYPIKHLRSDEVFDNGLCRRGFCECDTDCCRCCKVRMSQCCEGPRRNSVIPARYTVRSANSINSIGNDGKIYDFWKEHYNEADYNTTGHRQQIPTTS